MPIRIWINGQVVSTSRSQLIRRGEEFDPPLQISPPLLSDLDRTTPRHVSVIEGCSGTFLWTIMLRDSVFPIPPSKVRKMFASPGMCGSARRLRRTSAAPVEFRLGVFVLSRGPCGAYPRRRPRLRRAPRTEGTLGRTSALSVELCLLKIAKR